MPVELRLNIFEYLLTPYLTDNEVDQLKFHRHSCTISPVRSLKASLACKCTSRHIHPQILATNKQIYSEAMPVLYKNMEFRIEAQRLNYFCDPDGKPTPSPRLNRRIASLPTSALPFVTKLLITGRVADITDMRTQTIITKGPRLSPVTQQVYLLHYYCDCLEPVLPSLKHVRLALDRAGSNLSRTVQTATTTATVLAPFGRIATMKGLETVSIWFKDWNYNLEILKSFRGVIEEAAEQHGKNLAVYETNEVGRVFEELQPVV